MRPLDVRCLVVGVGVIWALLHPCYGALAPIIQNDGGSIGGQFIVKVKAGYAVKEVADEIVMEVESKGFADGVGHVEVLQQFEKAVPAIVMRLDYESELVAKGIAGVEYLEEDGIVKEEGVFLQERADPTPTDWGLDRINEIDRTLDGNLTINGDGFGVNVYVLDTGIQDLHRDFECRARHAYDAMGGDGFDECSGHGTAVAGIIGGRTYGVAKEATLHSVKVIGCEDDADSYYYHSVSLLVKGIDWVVQNKMSPCVVTIALSSGGSLILDEAVKKLHDIGCVVVAAAGEWMPPEVATTASPGKKKGERKPLPPPQEPDEDEEIVGLDLLHEACRRSPARSPHVLTAAAVDYNDNVPEWSNTGLCVDLFAPGDDIYTISHKNDDDFHYKSGTSMSAAFVAGVAAVHLANGVKEEGVATPIANELIRMRILRDAASCKVEEAGAGTPNRMLYIQ